MLISEKALDELIDIYKEEFGEEIDRIEATEMAHRLLTLYRLLMKTLPDSSIEASPPTEHLEEDEEISDRPPIGFQT
jgi:hypothetical protein